MAPFYQFKVYTRNKRTGSWDYLTFIEGEWDEIKESVDYYLEKYETDIAISNGWQHKTYYYGEEND